MTVHLVTQVMTMQYMQSIDLIQPLRRPISSRSLQDHKAARHSQLVMPY